MKPGQKVLVHAGSGGVGTIAIQLAKQMGATVATRPPAQQTSTWSRAWARTSSSTTRSRTSRPSCTTTTVLDNLGGATLEKSLRVLRPGGKVISIACPPDPAFAKELGANPVVSLVMSALNFRTRQWGRRRHVTYSFLFMRASGDQLGEVTAQIEARKIRPVVDRVFDFESTREALAYVEEGRAKAGKVVIRMK